MERVANLPLRHGDGLHKALDKCHVAEYILLSNMVDGEHQMTMSRPSLVIAKRVLGHTLQRYVPVVEDADDCVVGHVPQCSRQERVEPKHGLGRGGGGQGLRALSSVVCALSAIYTNLTPSSRSMVVHITYIPHSHTLTSTSISSAC